MEKAPRANYAHVVGIEVRFRRAARLKLRQRYERAQRRRHGIEPADTRA
ncbi:hypothetical protein BF49_3776 [Bradyrhizobium sp.]|nr:hypothetical protein BF49_3776 [Bradyrhizobium sp.]